jgi:hypothetical protein
MPMALVESEEGEGFGSEKACVKSAFSQGWDRIECRGLVFGGVHGHLDLTIVQPGLSQHLMKL